MPYRLTVHSNGTSTYIDATKGDSVLSLLLENGFHINSECHGSLSCGKCKVRATGLLGPMSDQELSLLSPEEIQNDMRLACALKIGGDSQIYL